MKKNRRRLFSSFFVFFAALSLFAQQNQEGRVLEESFENGIPTTWSQEVVYDNLQWIVESGDLTFPNGAFKGNKRVAFRNTSGKTKKASTRLVSPIFDVTKLYRPLLVFAHAQDQWIKDVDVLRVLYRLSPEAEWVELKTFDKCITFWQTDTVKLVGSSKTYQIAFEAIDNLGRGVVIDNVEIRSTPRCDTPYALDISEKTSSSVVINWLGAFDAKGFDLKVSTTPLSAEQLEDDSYKADVVDTSLPTSWNYKVTELVSGAKYYYYLRSLCDKEISGWAADSFEVANMITVPYYQNFNMKKTAGGLVSYVDKWAFGASKSATNPFVNTCLTDENWCASPDSTFALCFYGSDDVEDITAIRGGAYSYAVLPETEVEDMSKLCVSFSTVNWNSHLSDRFSIIVGVMTDPNDKTTFKAVDTVDVKSLRVYEEAEVTFENYKGAGKFIAFMSDFVESNMFTMDNLKIDYIPEVKKVTDFEARLITSTSLKFNFNSEYLKYEVAISPLKLEVSKIDSLATDIIKAEIANNGVVTGLVNNTNYFVYARAIDGDKKGEWGSYRVVRTPGKIDLLPYTESFTKTAENPLYAISYGEFVVTPKKYMANGLITLTSGAYSMYCDDAKCSEEQESGTINFGTTHTETDDPEKHLHAELGLNDYDLWAATVFPELTMDIRTVSVSFIGKNSSEDNNGAVIVGVMSSANDISTFQAIDTIKLDTKEKKYVYNLDEYDVEGQFFAFLVDSRLVQTTKNVVCVDDVRFSEIPVCKSPSDIEIVSVVGDPTKMTLQWKANGAKSWKIRLFEPEYKKVSKTTTNPITGVAKTTYTWEPVLPNIDSMYSTTYQYDYIYDNTVNTNSIQFTDLRPSGNVYYYTICSVCESGEEGIWSEFESFATNCYDEEPIPYVQNFDNKAYRVGHTFKGFAVPCMLTEQITNGTTIYSPSIANSQSATEYNSLIMSKAERTGNRNPYVALPKMSKPLTELQISFKTFGRESQPPILVGVMTDPLDTLTFEMVESIQPIVSEKASDDAPEEFLEYIVSFADYKGKGEYIALMLKDDQKYMDVSALIDDIVVDNIVPCERPENLKLADFTDKSVKLEWKSDKDVEQWRVVFAKSKLTTSDLSNPQVNNIITKVEIVNSNITWFSGLTAETKYYVYVQSMCSATDVSKWSNYLTFTTLCTPLSINSGEIEGFEGYGSGNGTFPTCYIVGSQTSKDADYIPYCSTDYAHTGKASLIIKTNEDNNKAYAITNSLAVEDIAEARLNFWGYTKYPNNSYAHSIVVGVLTSPADLGTFVPVDTISFSSEERPYEVYFNNYKYDMNGERGKFIMFYSEFDRPNEVFIDDISLGEASGCPTGFYFDEITATSFKLRFTTNNAPYQVKYSTLMVTDLAILDTDELPSFIVEGDSLLFENLKPYSTYYFYARSTCDGKYGEWSNVNVVNTSCLDVLTLPYFDDFDNQIAIDQAPECWFTYYQDMNIRYPALDKMTSALTPGSHPYSGTRSIHLRSSVSDTSYLVTPQIDVDDLSKCQVSFYLSPKAKNKNASIVVGVVSDITNINGSFEPIDTIIINRGAFDWTDWTVSLENYKGAGKHLGFVSDPSLNETTICIDDILIELIPTCEKTRHFKFVSHTSNSLTISFEGTGASKYEAVCGPVGFDVNNTENTIFESTDTVITLEGLSAATYYDVYVRAVCSDIDKSPWVAAGKYFTIGELLVEYPYIIDFDNQEENQNWMFKQDAQSNKWVIGSDTAHVVSDGIVDGGNALYVSWDGGLSAHYNNTSTSRSWAYRALDLQPGTYTISFDWTCVGEKKNSATGMDYLDYMRVGLLPTTSVFNAGSNLVTADDVSSVNLNPKMTLTSTPKGWIELTEEVADNEFAFNAVDKKKQWSEQWKTQVVTFVVDEKTAGTYNLVFFWNNNNNGGDYAEVRSAVIDNIEIVLDSCDMAYDLQIVEMGENYADLSWNVINSNVKGYQVDVEPVKVDIKVGSDNTKVFSQFVETNFVKITGLTDNTDYKAYIQVICDTNSVGVRTEPFLFTTNCRSIGVDSLLDFEDEDNHFYMSYTNGKANTGFPIPKCFVIGHENMTFSSSAYAKYFPNLIANSKTKKYSRSGDYALIFERTGKTGSLRNDGGYIALPDFDGDREFLQLSFWMRAVYENPNSKLIETFGAKQAAADYAKKLTVGTMTDPNDLATFEPITILEYPYDDSIIKNGTDVTNDPTGNEYWVEFRIPLVGTDGKYIAFKNELYGDSISNNIIYIDDIKLTSVECVRPEFVKVDSITTESVVVNCAHSNVEKHVVKIATDEDFTTNLRVDTVFGFPVKLSGLNPSTIYYLQMQSFCEEGRVSELSDVVTFTTLKTLPYTEVFDTDSYCPVDWKRANNITDGDLFVSGNGSAFYFVPEFNNDGWSQNGAIFRNGMFSSTHMSATVHCPGGDRSKASVHWMVSPNVVLPERNQLHLIFDLALTDMGATEPVNAEDLNAAPSTFMVVVSNDAGKTWKRENAVVWCTNKDDYEYFDIPFTGKKYSISLDKFAGDTIQVAFYVESSVDRNTSTEIHIDNVHVNEYIENIVEVSLCETQDYLNGDFYIPYSEMVLGDNHFDDWDLSNEVSVPDVLNLTKITVSPLVVDTISTSICEGDVYELNNFSGLMDAGIYKQKLSSVNKCDSLVVLDLSVTPTIRMDVVDTICLGQKYVLNGKEYRETGIYIDTLISTVTYCDSIVTLALIVNDAIRENENVNICFGDSLVFGSQVIVKSGVYEEKFTSVNGCDSIVSLTATVLPDLRQTINATIKDGEKYNENGFNGLYRQGTYTLRLTSQDGCDSTITLNLVVITTDTTYVEFEITTEDLPYEYYDVFYDENTQPGTYIDTILISQDSIDYVIIHTLTITLVDDIDNVVIEALSIVPNPLKVNQILYINNEFTVEERNSLVVEVFDMLGQSVYIDKPMNYPIAIDGMSQSGLYVVRITTGTGSIYQGKILFE